MKIKQKVYHNNQFINTCVKGQHTIFFSSSRIFCNKCLLFFFGVDVDYFCVMYNMIEPEMFNILCTVKYSVNVQYILKLESKLIVTTFCQKLQCKYRLS